MCLFCGELFRYKSITSNYAAKNNCCGDGVSWTFLAVMRCFFFRGVVVFRGPPCPSQRGLISILPLPRPLTSVPSPLLLDAILLHVPPSFATTQDFVLKVDSHTVMMKCSGSHMHYTTPKLKVHVPFSEVAKFIVMSNVRMQYEHSCTVSN